MAYWCTAVTKSGKACPRPALKGQQHCLFHLSGDEKVSISQVQKPLTYQKTIIDFFDKDCAKVFKDKESWECWRAFCKICYGIPLGEEEMELYQYCTKREKPPSNPIEIYSICGRRGGKSFISAFMACFEALYNPWIGRLAPGEKGSVFIIATDRRQAGIVLNYCKGILDTIGQKAKVYREQIELEKTLIEVKTASFRAGRGYSTLMIVLDELAFFRDEASANPAEEIINSLLPGLVEGGKLVGISTPYARMGYLYESYAQYFAKENEDVLIWVAPTQLMNSSYSEKQIDKLIRRGEAMRSEFMAEFRTDVESYLTREEVEGVMEHEAVYHQVGSERYFAFCDMSGGRNDSSAL